MRKHARNGGCLAKVPPSAAQDHRESEAKGQDRRSAARCAAVPAPRSRHGRQPVWPRSAGLFFKAEELRLGCGGPGSSPCSSTRAPTPRPWQSSVLVRSGAFFLPWPLRRSSAHVSAMSGAVAAVVAVELLQRAAR